MAMIGRDRAIVGQEWGQNSDKNSIKTARKGGKNVLNVAKYLPFYPCYLILCDVKNSMPFGYGLYPLADLLGYLLCLCLIGSG